jgi:hypothetical protein
VNALRLPAMVLTWLAATREKPGGRGRGVEILAESGEFSGGYASRPMVTCETP